MLILKIPEIVITILFVLAIFVLVSTLLWTYRKRITIPKLSWSKVLSKKSEAVKAETTPTKRVSDLTILNMVCDLLNEKLPQTREAVRQEIEAYLSIKQLKLIFDTLPFEGHLAVSGYLESIHFRLLQTNGVWKIIKKT